MRGTNTRKLNWHVSVCLFMPRPEICSVFRWGFSPLFLCFCETTSMWLNRQLEWQRWFGAGKKCKIIIIIIIIIIILFICSSKARLDFQHSQHTFPCSMNFLLSPLIRNFLKSYHSYYECLPSLLFLNHPCYYGTYNRLTCNWGSFYGESIGTGTQLQYLLWPVISRVQEAPPKTAWSLPWRKNIETQKQSELFQIR